MPALDTPSPTSLAARLAWLERVLKFDFDRAAREAAKAEYLTLTDPNFGAQRSARGVGNGYPNTGMKTAKHVNRGQSCPLARSQQEY